MSREQVFKAMWFTGIAVVIFSMGIHGALGWSIFGAGVALQVGSLFQ